MKKYTAALLLSLLTFVGLISASALALSDGVTELIEDERGVNRAVDTQLITALENHQDAHYSPEGGEWFEVKSYWVPDDKLFAFDTQTFLTGEFSREVNGKRQFLFLVHPESEAFYTDFLKGMRRGPDFKATATASSRTLLVTMPAQPNGWNKL